jgi:hypothetical protein
VDFFLLFSEHAGGGEARKRQVVLRTASEVSSQYVDCNADRDSRQLAVVRPRCDQSEVVVREG